LVGIATNHSSSLILPKFAAKQIAKVCQTACLHKSFLLCGKIGAIQLSKSEQPIPTFTKGIV
jgi:hypothetical protein